MWSRLVDRLKSLADKDDSARESAAASETAPEKQVTSSSREPVNSGAGVRSYAESEPRLPDEESRTLALFIGTHLIAQTITSFESDQERSEKMERVTDLQRAGLSQLLTEGGKDSTRPGDVFVTLVKDWSAKDRTGLLIDLDFGEPFFPYSLEYSGKDFEQGLREVAAMSGSRRDLVEEIKATRKSAQRAHQRVSWTRVGLFGAGGLLLVGTAGFLLAPLLGTALGAAAGLSGAAATSHGLALLGGGSLAAGGAGVAGGMWMVTGVGAAAGFAAVGGSSALLELGAAQTRAELTRLQVTFKMTLLAGQVDTVKAQHVMTQLQDQADMIRERLEEECRLNDENSARIKDLKEQVVAIEESIGWMESEKAQAS